LRRNCAAAPRPLASFAKGDSHDQTPGFSHRRARPVRWARRRPGLTSLGVHHRCQPGNMPGSEQRDISIDRRRRHGAIPPAQRLACLFIRTRCGQFVPSTVKAPRCIDRADNLWSERRPCDRRAAHIPEESVKQRQL